MRLIGAVVGALLLVMSGLFAVTALAERDFARECARHGGVVHDGATATLCVGFHGEVLAVR